MQRPTVGLALGAGSARGMAHLGVLMALQEENIPIDVIAGTSIGSIFGALYADGADLNMVSKIAENIRHEQLVDVTLPKMGLIKGDKVEEFFRLITKDKSFDQLAKPFYVVAADIETGEEVIINTGKLADALRASASIPGVFQPKKIGNRLLVDGATKNYVPINVLKMHGVDYIIAVDVRFGGKIGIKYNVQNIFDVILIALEISHLDSIKQLGSECNVLIQPNLSHISPARFDLVQECMEIGMEETKKHLSTIKEDLKALGVI